MYKIILNSGEVIRLSDNVVVAPTGDSTNPDYLNYIQWVNDGNQPTEVIDESLNSYWLLSNQFRNRFTDLEQIAILDAAYSGDETCRLLLFKLQTSHEIDINSQIVIDGVAYFVSLGILSQDRANLILLKE
jgi:hypothetical protein